MPRDVSKKVSQQFPTYLNGKGCEIFSHLIFASLAAGESGTTKRTWMGSQTTMLLLLLLLPLLLPLMTPLEAAAAAAAAAAGSLAPPTMENPQLARSRRWRITVLGYWRLFCKKRNTILFYVKSYKNSIFTSSAASASTSSSG